jgi:hypothetical protein
MKNLMSVTTLLGALAITGCSAIPIENGAQFVELVNDRADTEQCKFLGEIIGSQGNAFTGDFTANKTLVIGARNQLRNEAVRLGANVVYVQDMSNTRGYGSLGNNNTTIVGKAYLCN